jgi:hypothetical protein
MTKAWTLYLFATAPPPNLIYHWQAIYIIYQIRSQPTHEINLLMRPGPEFGVAQNLSGQLHRCELP